MKKKIFYLFLILVVGGFGGLLAEHLLLPYLAKIPVFSNLEFIRQISNGTTIINPTERIYVAENTVIEEAIDRIGPRLVSVESYYQGSLTNRGAGFIVASDGLIVTNNDLIPSWASQYLVWRNGHSIAGEVIKRDVENNLALIRIEENNLPVVSFADLDKIRLGERIILAARQTKEENFSLFVNLGIVRALNNGILKINFEESNPLANGSPLINLKGEVIGLNLIENQKLTETIPVNKLKDFIGL